MVGIFWLRYGRLMRGTSNGRVLALGGDDFRRRCRFRSALFRGFGSCKLICFGIRVKYRSWTELVLRKVKSGVVRFVCCGSIHFDLEHYSFSYSLLGYCCSHEDGPSLGRPLGLWACWLEQLDDLLVVPIGGIRQGSPAIIVSLVLVSSSR